MRMRRIKLEEAATYHVMSRDVRTANAESTPFPQDLSTDLE